ncbi:MAG: efflux RND transporter periplasmic adaptor subunit [Gammaproteobacteria bacterium]|nr:efflux RND transporter periplasmic adaptor subunit [Rhodocyclaceae bacterium]MBU3910724.1 efflux RND transporter periplasmic adaptor subunit [Gammaproteobacteria bacterium]MBU3989940.1 efflux RND transporter periplasmic adaptor subunit [Gammaproteobacteria bacterium]MBU4003433.1 efflux RND transporter periplasmic adaptor subunit [Gammaproteobacteria bacterium]MBU4021904.1 efflux RND transporter periplasmic adaptor subunit [Gammaproteobacteria bacterium]
MSRQLALVCLAAFLLAACDKKPADNKPSGPPPTLITVTQVKSAAFEVTEDTLGTLEAVINPKIAAEVAGKIIKVLVVAGTPVKQGETLAVIDATDFLLQNQAEQADVKRLEALLAQQDKLVERQQSLVAKGFLSQNAADDAAAQRAAIAEQLAAAQARTGLGKRSVGKTTVTAPFDGVIESRMIASGDYVKLGDPLFQLVSNQHLRAHLPFPESAAPRLSRGQVVRLSSPQAPGKIFTATISDIRPAVAESSRALDVIVDLDGAGLLRAGGTVNASVQIAAKAAALVVPEQSVVLRPAGKVVYVIADADGKKTAQQRIVQAGAKKDGVIEIIAGLEEGELVAQDGAGFLTNGASVSIKEPGKPGAGKAEAKGKPPGKPEEK